jgi:hypothetical protein
MTDLLLPRLAASRWTASRAFDTLVSRPLLRPISNLRDCERDQCGRMHLARKVSYGLARARSGARRLAASVRDRKGTIL